MNYYIYIGLGFAFLTPLIGSSVIFFFKKDISKKTNVIFFSLSAGIMFAATIWSLLIPSIEKSEGYGSFNFVPAIVGILIGALFFVFLDYIVKIIKGKNDKNYKLKSSTKLFLAVTIHNIPEGLAIGFAFGVALLTKDPASFISALSLAIGIGIQNMPEGAAIALPLQKEFNNKGKTFLYCVLSSLVEPIAAVIGILLASSLSSIMCYILSFAAGAMIYVIIEELMPEIRYENSSIGTWCFIIGFIIMMTLDVALG